MTITHSLNIKSGKSLLSGGITILIIAILAIIVRLIYLDYHGIAITGDSPEYILLAKNIYYHGEYSYNSSSPFTPAFRRAPVYPFFIAVTAPFHKWSLTGVVYLQIILSSATAVMIYLIIRISLSHHFYRLFASILYVFHPGSILFSVAINNESLYTFLLTLSIYFIVLSQNNKNSRYYFLSSLMLGLATLCRPVSTLLVPILAVAGGFSCELKHHTKGVLLYCGLSILLIAPWVAYVSYGSERFVYIQSARMVSVYLATLQWDMTDSGHDWKKFMETDPYSLASQKAFTPKEMAAVDDYARELTIQNLLHNPLYIIKQRLKNYPKLFLTTFPSITGGNQWFSPAIQNKKWKWVAFKLAFLILFCLLPLCLSFVSLKMIGVNSTVLICGVVWLYMLIIHVPLWIEYRFWIPVVPVQLISTAYGLYIISARYKIINAQVISKQNELLM